MRAGLKTTLIERCEPGRAKVCGCCLGALGRATLQGLGLHDVLRSAGPLHTLRLVTHGRQASLPLRGFVSVARESFDHDLARRAEAAGADVHWLTRAQASPDGTVRLSTGRTLRARVVVDASGLSGSALTLDGGRALAGGGESVAPRSRMGLGLVGVGGASRPGELVMAVGRHGYVGMVALPDGRTDLAAAMDPHAVRSAGGPARAVGALWRSAGLDAGDLPAADRWRGTPRLTRRRPAQEGRILRVGDAAGYVEPFTGEGMSWAIVASSAVLEDCLACVRDGPAASRWPKRLAGLLGGRQRRCRLVCRAVRMPTLVAAGVRLAGLGPAWWSAALVARSCGAGPLA
ncbi:MAG: FAD-containing oxidoreductase [Phycisphaerales bacterium]|nr:MAG: FAD-containing oxidoreductase [Phycisphaerales bacterium]